MILLDWMSLIFMGFVLFISSLVIFYRKEYMFYDRGQARFLLLVILFILSIILIVVRPNLVSILLG